MTIKLNQTQAAQAILQWVGASLKLGEEYAVTFAMPKERLEVTIESKRKPD